MIKRLMMGAIIGGAAAYYFDPVSGAARRQKLAALWSERREDVVNAGAGAVSTAQQTAGKVQGTVQDVRQRSEEPARSGPAV